MGCDIHISIQRQNADGAWVEIPWQETPWDENKPTLPDIAVAPKGFGNRNYDLFAILADVRNGYGFAGCLTCEPWPPIAQPRGLPEGFSEDAVLPNPDMRHYASSEHEPRWLGDHSHSWLLLSELDAFAWDLTCSRQYGYVEAAVYEELKDRNLPPPDYCGGISGKGIVEYTPERYEAAKADGTLAEHPYVRMSWTETAREATSDWPGQVLPWLASLADGQPLRLVFGFDS